jgi:hypothetical protein
MKQPWVKFYTTDWRADPRLRMCSLAARGLWIELNCLMHEAIPYGHLLISGQCPTDAQLAVLVGAAPDEITALLGELEAAGVFSRTREGVIYSGKLSRMAKKAAMARNNGRKGGNPSLWSQRENPASDKGKVKGWVKPQSPEARVQTLEKKEEPTGSSKKKPRRPEVELPAGWVPNKRNLADARERNFTETEIEFEADRFRNHHQARQSRFRDWDAAWRTWLSNARRFAPRGVAGGAVSSGRGPARSFASVVARRRGVG